MDITATKAEGTRATNFSLLDNLATDAFEALVPYTPVKKDELRVMSVHLRQPGDIGELVKCTLEHIAPSDINEPAVIKSDYIALSYCWGWDSEAPSSQIVVDGHLVKVTESLEIALSCIRQREEMRLAQHYVYVWVDALCINHGDKAESRAEILRMGDIYSGAKEVFVHLGKSTDHSELGLQLARSIATDLSNGINLKSQLDGKTTYGRSDCTSAERDAYVAFVDIWNRPYWSRVWILQELRGGNGKTTVAYGNEWISFEELASSTEFVLLNLTAVIALVGNVLPLNGDSLVASQVLLWTRQAWKRAEYMTSTAKLTYTSLRMPTLTMGQNAKATRAHDKIYGILGMMPAEIRASMERYIDYDLPLHEVFIAFAKATIACTNSLDVIFAKNVKQTSQPSWATDWTLPLLRAGVPHDWDMYCYDFYDGAYPNFQATIDASMDAHADQHRMSTVSFPKPFLLACQGVRIGTIDGMAASIMGGTCTQAERTQIQPTCQMSPYGDDEATSRALVHTLFAHHAWGDKGGASFLHIPWLAGDSYTTPVDITEPLSAEDPAIKAMPVMADNGWFFVYRESFIPFEAHRRNIGSFRMAGKPFKDYFDQEITKCCYPEERVRVDLATFLGASTSRRLVVLNTGHFGLAPNTVEPGDAVYVILGCSVPVILKSVPGTSHYAVVGECYVDGFAQGEAIDALDDGSSSIEELVLT